MRPHTDPKVGNWQGQAASSVKGGRKPDVELKLQLDLPPGASAFPLRGPRQVLLDTGPFVWAGASQSPKKAARSERSPTLAEVPAANGA